MPLEWENSKSRLPDMREQNDQSISLLNLDSHALDQALSQGTVKRRFAFGLSVLIVSCKGIFVDIHTVPGLVLE
jgi:hypothetical protein